MNEAIVTMKDVGYTMFQGLGVAEISKGVMNCKSPYECERLPKSERKIHIQKAPSEESLQAKCKAIT